MAPRNSITILNALLASGYIKKRTFNSILRLDKALRNRYFTPKMRAELKIIENTLKQLENLKRQPPTSGLGLTRALRRDNLRKTLNNAKSRFLYAIKKK